MDAEILIEHHTQKGNVVALMQMWEDISPMITELQEEVRTLVRKRMDPSELKVHLKSAEDIYLKVQAAISKIS